MKFVFLILLLTGVHAGVAASAAQPTTAAPTWIDEDARIVSVMPTAVLTTSVLEIKASNENWALLSYEWKYSISDYQKELAELKRLHPGFEIARAKVVAGASKIELVVRPLDLRVPVELIPEIEGAYFHGSFPLTKAQYQQLRAAKIAPDAAYALEGSVTVEITKAVVKERLPLNPQVCARLLEPGRTTRDLIENLARAVSELERRPGGLADADRDAWLGLALEHCFGGPGFTWVRGLKDVLGVPLEVRPSAELRDHVRSERRLVPERTAPTWIWRGRDAHAD